MSKSYQPWTQDQPYLLPPSLRDWLPEGHLAWFVVDVVSQLDLSAIETAIQRKDARGQRPYHPSMMVALLIYAYCTGVYSSRRIERACHEDVAFRVLTGNSQPFFTTINEFRRQHRTHFSALFVQVLKLCRAAGLVKLRHVAIDGTKIKANASKHKAMSYQRMVREERRLNEEVERLLSEADAADAADDKRYGAGQRDEEIPAELRRRETRLARIREAKAALEAQARESRAEQLRALADGLEARAEHHERDSDRRRAHTNARKHRARADELDPPHDDEEPPSGVCETGTLPLKGTPATPEGKPKDSAQRNFNDPDSCLMVGADGFIQGYNAQLAVDEAHQIIVACGVTNRPPDVGNFVPMVQRIGANLGETPEHTTGDAGYWHDNVEAQAHALGTQAWVATRRHRHGSSEPESTSVADNNEARQRMRTRLNSTEGRAIYARRKAVVEPVNGQIKHARGFRQFSFRGLVAVEHEWDLISVCHNMLKLFRYAPIKPCPS